MKNIIHYVATLACLALLVSATLISASAEEAGAGKSKAAAAFGTITGIDSAGKKLTVTLKEKKKKKKKAEGDEVDDNDGDDNEAEEKTEEAVPKTLTVICTDDTVIKSGKDKITFAELSKDAQVMVKYDPESSKAISVRIKKKKVKGELRDRDGEEKEQKKKKQGEEPDDIEGME